MSDINIIGYDTISQRGVVLTRNGTGQFVVEKQVPAGIFGAAWKIGGKIFMAVGSQILQYDGFEWLGIGRSREQFNGIGGSAPDNIVVTGTFTGADGLVLRYNGSAWSGMESDVISDNSFAQVSVSDTGQWIVALNNAGIARYDGNTWQQQSSAVSGYFVDLWSAGGKVFIVGTLTTGDALILSSTDSGQTWQPEAIPANFNSAQLSSIWGAGSNGPFFTAGTSWDGSAYHPIVLISLDTGSWTGTEITSLPLTLKDIWGRAANDVYVSGDFQYGLGESIREIHHFNGSNWERVFESHDTEGDLAFGELIGSSTGDFFAFGSSPLYKDKCTSAWQDLDAPGIPVSSIQKVWGIESIDGTYSLYAITDDSVYRYVFDVNKECSSSWPLFLPAILSGNR